jgi:hypothetical protein
MLGLSTSTGVYGDTEPSFLYQLNLYANEFSAFETFTVERDYFEDSKSYTHRLGVEYEGFIGDFMFYDYTTTSFSTYGYRISDGCGVSCTTCPSGGEFYWCVKTCQEADGDDCET